MSNKKFGIFCSTPIILWKLLLWMCFIKMVSQGEGVKDIHLLNKLAGYYCCTLCTANFKSRFGR